MNQCLLDFEVVAAPSPKKGRVAKVVKPKRFLPCPRMESEGSEAPLGGGITVEGEVLNLVLRMPKTTPRVKDGGGTSVTLSSSQMVAGYMRTWRDSDREWLAVLLLDVKNNLIEAELVSVGDVSSAGVAPRTILRSALMVGASNVVIVHNHPSGDPEPSLCDKDLTRDLVQAAHLLQVTVLDHVIISPDPKRHFSFADRGMITEYLGTGARGTFDGIGARGTL